MTRYKIYQKDIDLSKEKLDQCGGYREYWNKPYDKEKWLRLYDRNVNRFMWFQIVRKLKTEYGWLVERHAPVWDYWSDILKQQKLEEEDDENDCNHPLQEKDRVKLTKHDKQRITNYYKTHFGCEQEDCEGCEYEIRDLIWLIKDIIKEEE